MSDEWITLPLNEAVLINPFVPLKKGNAYPFVDMQTVTPNEKKVRAAEIRIFDGGGSRFQVGDILMARITPSLEHGKISKFVADDPQTIAHGSTEFIVIRGKPGVTDTDFAYYLVKWDYVRQYAISQMTGSSGRQRVPVESLQFIDVPVPPLPEQRAIAAVLGALDDKIELNRRMNRTLEAIAQAVFRHWFVENEEAEGWEEKPLDEIADFLNGLALQKFPPKEDEGYLPVIKIAQLRKNDTDGADKASVNIPPEYIVKDGDILFSWSGSLEVVAWCGGKGALNQHLFKVTSKKYPKWFYYYWIKHHLPDFQKIAAGKATTMGHIQRHHLKEAMVLVPSDKELREMDKIMSPLLEKIILNEQQSRTLAALRDALLPKLLRGEVRVKDTAQFLEER
jgi:type I restriction enzyme S subunit